MKIFFFLASLSFSAGVLLRNVVAPAVFYIFLFVLLFLSIGRKWWYIPVFVFLGFLLSQRVDLRGVEILGVVSNESPPVVRDIEVWVDGSWRGVPGGFRSKEYVYGSGVYCLGDLTRVPSHPEYRFEGSCFDFPLPRKNLFERMVLNLKERLRDYERNVAQIAPRVSGMVLSRKDEEVYSSGLTPFFAVSGYHMGLIFVIFRVAFSSFTYRMWLLNSLSLIPTLLFLLSVGVSPSALRAFSMLSIHVLFKSLDYPVHPLNVLGISALASLLVDPYLVFSPSFLLSYSATAGILLGIEKRSSLFLIPFYAFLSSLPISILLFGRVHVLAPLLSLLMIPLSSLGIFAGAMSLILYSVGFEGLGTLILRGSKPIDSLIDVLLKIGSKAPTVNFHGPISVISSLVIMGVILRVILSESRGWSIRSPRGTV